MYYKVLNLDGSCFHDGNGVWSTNRWMPKLDEAKLEPCVYGYHVLEEQDLIYWLGPAIAPVDVKGVVIRSNNKSVVAQAKRGKFLSTWTPVTQRLFAADCAEHVLHYWTDKYPNDDRPANAINAARMYARGQITAQQLEAAIAATYTAATATYTAAIAASTAASTAATAAIAATYTAAYAAERQWQSTRLWQYLNGEVQ